MNQINTQWVFNRKCVSTTHLLWGDVYWCKLSTQSLSVACIGLKITKHLYWIVRSHHIRDVNHFNTQ
jgi:hypothetical protein